VVFLDSDKIIGKKYQHIVKNTNKLGIIDTFYQEWLSLVRCARWDYADEKKINAVKSRRCGLF
jgi:hypothetical protein